MRTLHHDFMNKMHRSPIRPKARRTGDGVSTILRLGTNDEEAITLNNEVQISTSKSTLHLQVSTAIVHQVMQQAEQEHQLMPAEEQNVMHNVAHWNTATWNQLHAASRCRYTTSQRMAVKQQILKAWDEAEVQIQLNRKLLKALNESYIQQGKLKKALHHSMEKSITDARHCQNQEAELRAELMLLRRQGDKQHQILVQEQLAADTQMQETQTLSYASRDSESGRVDRKQSSCPRCICPHCRRPIHEVVDLSLSDSEEETMKFIQ